MLKTATDQISSKLKGLSFSLYRYILLQEKEVNKVSAITILDSNPGIQSIHVLNTQTVQNVPSGRQQSFNRFASQQDLKSKTLMQGGRFSLPDPGGLKICP